jgi:hypothetical protein
MKKIFFCVILFISVNIRVRVRFVLLLQLLLLQLLLLLVGASYYYATNKHTSYIYNLKLSTLYFPFWFLRCLIASFPL